MALSSASEGTRSSLTNLRWHHVPLFPSQCVLFVLPGKCICRVPLTWDMTNLQVVPLHDIDPLPDAGIDARLVGKVTERSVVRLNTTEWGPRQ